MEIEFCRNCSYHRFASIKYGVDYSFWGRRKFSYCTEYEQPIKNISFCGKRKFSYVKHDNGNIIKKRTVANRLKIGFEMLCDDEIVHNDEIY